MGNVFNKRSPNYSGINVFIMAFALMAIVYAMLIAGVHVGFAIAFMPIAIAVVLAVLKKPFLGFVLLFLLNYFIIPIINYTGTEGLSLVMDILIVYLLITVAINHIFIPDPDGVAKFNPFNGLLVASLIWIAYCSLELLNPSAMLQAWFLSRATIFYIFIISLVTFLLVDSFKKVQTILMILSVLTIIGVIKGLTQKYVGFDPVERFLLNTSLRKTHMLATGVRYFSIFASAGVFGAIMGQSFVIFLIASIYTKSKGKRIYFLIVALAAVYSMFISGTRGALAVPFVGMCLFVLLSRNMKLIIPSSALLISAYVFLAMTTIGQSNHTIRRMRTVFEPNEPSLMVRLENQRLLAGYLQHRPFGEGLGLSGVENQSVSHRFTTTVPTDSWYVKIWVETGIIGLILYICLFIYIVLHGCYIVLFRIKDTEIRGTLMGLLCGAVGILVSAYGNAILGQYPISIITFSSLAIVFMGKYLDAKHRGELSA